MFKPYFVDEPSLVPSDPPQNQRLCSTSSHHELTESAKSLASEVTCSAIATVNWKCVK